MGEHDDRRGLLVSISRERIHARSESPKKRRHGALPIDRRRPPRGTKGRDPPSHVTTRDTHGTVPTADSGDKPAPTFHHMPGARPTRSPWKTEEGVWWERRFDAATGSGARALGGPCRRPPAPEEGGQAPPPLVRPAPPTPRRPVRTLLRVRRFRPTTSTAPDLDAPRSPSPRSSRRAPRDSRWFQDLARTNRRPRRQGRRSSWNYGGDSSGRRGHPEGGFAWHGADAGTAPPGEGFGPVGSGGGQVRRRTGQLTRGEIPRRHGGSSSASTDRMRLVYPTRWARGTSHGHRAGRGRTDCSRSRRLPYPSIPVREGTGSSPALFTGVPPFFEVDGALERPRRRHSGRGGARPA